MKLIFMFSKKHEMLPEVTILSIEEYRPGTPVFDRFDRVLRPLGTISDLGQGIEINTPSWSLSVKEYFDPMSNTLS